MRCREARSVKKLSIISVLLILLVFQTGCWNNRDLSEINLVSAVGVELTEEGKVLLTVQVVEPSAVQLTSGSGGSGKQKPVFVESYEGETVFEAIRGILSIVDKKLFFSTSQVLILGEKLSQKGIQEVLDFFLREHEVEYTMDVLVSKGVSPRDILEMESKMDSIPSVYIKGTIENTISRGTVKKTILIDLAKDLCGCGNQLTIGQITKAGEEEVKTEGTAIFKDGKMIGSLDPYETRGYLFAVGKLKSAAINLSENNEKTAIEIIRAKSKIGIEFKEDKPDLLTILVQIDANVAQYGGKEILYSPDNLKVLQEILGEEVEKEIKMAMDKAQEDSVDIFGFGVQLHKYYPQYWNNVKSDWNNIFSKLPVDIQVDAKIRRAGVIKGPI